MAVGRKCDDRLITRRTSGTRRDTRLVLITARPSEKSQGKFSSSDERTLKSDTGETRNDSGFVHAN